MLKKRELIHFVISILILSLVFGWNDGKSTFDVAYFLANFLKIIILVTLTLLVHELGHKLTARFYDAETEYELITLERIWFKGKLKKPIPVFPIVAVFLAIVSKGQLFFTGIAKTKILTQSKRRVGRKFIELTGYEEALILFSGPLANILLILLLTILGRMLGTNFPTFITINLFVALWYMVPLPGFDGNGIYFGSRFFYIFGLAFLVLALLLQTLSPIWGTLGALLLATIIGWINFWKQQ